MTVSRRNFLCLLTYAPTALAVNRFAFKQSVARRTEAEAAPHLTNHRADGRAILVEGKTLLVTFEFASNTDNVTGDLPIRIKPASLDGAPLVEPQPLYFYPSGDGGRTFRAILAAPLDLIEGSSMLRLSASQPESRAEQFTFPYLLQSGSYRRSTLTLDKSFSAPPPEVAQRMRADFETMVKIYQQRTPRGWHAPFMQPVAGMDEPSIRSSGAARMARKVRPPSPDG